MEENLKFIDLFAGIGGFRIALESFGHKCVFSSEWDKYAQITYKENFNELPMGDITKISETDVPDMILFVQDFHVRHLVFLENKKVLRILEEHCFLRF